MPSPAKQRKSALRLPTESRPFHGALVRSWFDDALGRAFKPRPSAAECEVIASKTIALLYAVEDGYLPLDEQRNVSPEQIRSDRLTKVFDAANNLLAAMEDLKPYWPGGDFSQERDGIPLDRLEQALHAIPVAGVRRTPADPTPGKPKAAWRPIGRHFAALVRDALIGLDYPGKVDATDPASITAEIGARMVSYISHDTSSRGAVRAFSADAFASQMSGERKTRAKNPVAMFPHAHRLRSEPYSPIKAGRKAAV